MTAANFTALALDVTTVIGYAMTGGLAVWGLILGTKAGMSFFSRFTH